ncbi:hypothetical protein PISMIDRAFT_683835 [Pisolithus microcarpus 441]|uniref:Uncharacterized protein n=1 Tax=Pisolithus microcarpus 441 TaxID=765257 RepID=A0A0C9YQA5_9AGAM|nr:hypothetical protein PISMIDRAFT_683835 [Pisolithus microcarpus 441]
MMVKPDTATATLPEPNQAFIHADHLSLPGGNAPAAFFAFAAIKGVVCLVQVTTPRSMDSTSVMLDVSIFRHEFVSMWRFSHTVQLYPSEIGAFVALDTQSIRYEEDSGTIFLAKDLMWRLKGFMDATSQTKASRSRPAARRQRI